MTRGLLRCTVVALSALAFSTTTRIHAFSVTPRTTTARTTTTLYDKKEYSRELYLREEAESPFRKVRFFFYFSLGGGALTSLAVSTARIAAGLNGINTDLLDESLINAGVDLVGIAAVAFFFQRDLAAQESRLQRASKGAELAKLQIRCPPSLLSEGLEEEDGNKPVQTSLASLRRGRGIEKRVVIAAAGPDKIQEVLQQADELKDSLEFSDLLVVPVVLPQCTAPATDSTAVALPVGSNWKIVVEDEAQQAVDQGVDVAKEGFCVILKKNGRVGQRTRGVFLNRMVGEVAERQQAGMDIKNI